MLHRYSFENFRAFHDPVEVSFRLTPADPVNGWAMDSPSGERITTAMAVIGPNASGKTTLLQPLGFLAWFISHSFAAAPDAILGITPHFRRQHEPTEFEVVTDGDTPGSLFRYRLSTFAQRVVSESLEKADTVRGKFRMIFDRNEGSGSIYRVTVSDDFGLAAEQAVNVRQNVSLISWARQYGVRMAQEITQWTAISNLAPNGMLMQHPYALLMAHASQLAKYPARQNRMRDIMKRLDLGLSDVEIREVVRTIIDPAASGKKPEWTPFGVHRDGNKKYELPFFSESSGTQALFNLLANVLVVIEHGGMMIYDELDDSLHPHLIEPVLSLFSSRESNPLGAQIIFTTHAADTVLRFLQKSQVMLVDRDGLSSDAFRLDDMEGVRSDENRAARYRAGAYGAIPRV